ncbi:16S rRNA (adenine(1518)-N(6)/adenine(1519)-N(6))-dimethyltransferase RsmA [Geobacter sp. AOG2]|uniref:16S rRNA (adenine(1518)-N(6)/adenine(1519)-N(6))- dimethyltransferase RsmA n=1 Tax=Geobacter sp. AOG2 TaxID=1566347 RepID=UPI001CC389A2|nr:16S rRNA (adenine(1518)-N(6)/adenine(1519)-N(6))-dimethyltransferase RsmA [Geobacter sp. AOG2]GFE61010.1 ribosomal RNA small subunit methyltransferase A [Geobacter sp. AOG2]
MTTLRRPLKSLGQNFLVDGNIIAKIIRTAEPDPEDSILEIGPGRGALSDLLVQNARRLTLVEFDHALAAALKERYAGNDLVTVIDGDILELDLAEVLGKEQSAWKVVANLPYNISTPILFRLLEMRGLFSRLVLMLQREVGERLVASPDCADYGVTTLLLGLWFDIRREFIVPPTCFHPRPKVDSAVLSFVPLHRPRVEVGDEAVFRKVVKGAFAMRRKTLSNCLKATELASVEDLREILQQCGIDGKRRGETLSMEEFASLSRSLSKFSSTAEF